MPLSPVHSAPSKTGSEFGPHTYHIPNSFSRSPQADREEEEFDYHTAAKSSAVVKGLYEAALGVAAAATHHKQQQGEEDDAELEAREHGDGGEEEEVSGEEQALLNGQEVNGNGDGSPPGRVDWEHDPWLTPLRRTIVLIAFGLLGAAVLLPFSTLSTPTEYYRSLLANSSVPKSFLSWLLLSYNIGTILFGAHATVSLHTTTPARRIALSSTIILLCLGLFTAFTAIPLGRRTKLAEDLTFMGLVLFAFALAASTSYLQNAVVSLCSIFGGRAMAIMLTGQGLVGLVISLVQLLAAQQNTKHHPHDKGPNRNSPTLPDDLQRAASKAATVFFAFSTLFMLVAFGSFLWLVRSRIYKITCQAYDTAQRNPPRIVVQGEDGEMATTQQQQQQQQAGPMASFVEKYLPISSRRHAHHLLSVQKRIALHCFCILYIFSVTLSVFPSITARVGSTSPTERGWKSPLLFVAIHFVIFNTSDSLGRCLPSISAKIFVVKSEKLIVAFTLLRTLFVPLFLLCDVRSSTLPPLTPSEKYIFGDLLFFLILFLFGLTNGWLATCIFVQGPSTSSLKDDGERALAGAVLSFWLTLGLAVGSGCSLLVGIML